MKVNIVGTNKRSGVSKKSGNAYTAVDLYFTYPATNVNGVVAAEKTLFDSDLEAHPVIYQIKPGDVVNLDYGPTGRVVGVEIVPASSSPAQPVNRTFGK